MPENTDHCGMAKKARFFQIVPTAQNKPLRLQRVVTREIRRGVTGTEDAIQQERDRGEPQASQLRALGIDLEAAE